MRAAIIVNLNKIAEEIYKVNEKNGFWEDRLLPAQLHNKGNINLEQFQALNKAIQDQALMLVVSEVAEAQEGNRKNRNVNKDELIDLYDRHLSGQIKDEEFKAEYKDKLKDRFETELIGCLFRVLDMCHGYGIDVEKLVSLELKNNSLREYKHGKLY